MKMQEAIKAWEELEIKDDFLFAKVMRDKRLCKKLLERLLQTKIKDIVYLEEQKSIDIEKDAKSIRLDVYIEEGTRVCQEDKELKLNDGTKKIFFNAKDYINAEDEEVREFLKYVNGEKSDSPFVKEIEDRVAKVKASKEWRLEYVTLLMREQEIWEEAEEKGREEEREEGIRGLVTVLKELNVPLQTILVKIQQQYNLSPEASQKYL